VNLIIRVFRVVTRIIIFASYVSVYLVRGFGIHFLMKDPVKRKEKFSKLAFWITGLVSRSFNIRVTVINEPPKNASGMIVGNHLGFVDILAAGSVRPILFVTSMEMRQTPVLGLLTELGGCIYVERRNRMGIQQELQQIIQSLKEGFNVCLFPEATSHNGEHVLPFKRTLLTAAAYANVPIHPYVFNFRSIEGKPFSFKNRDHVCWYGDIPFITAMVKAVSLKYVDVEIKFLPPVHINPEMDRAEIAQNLHNMISQEFAPVKMTNDSAAFAHPKGI
jgi:1-acyl-sn-glycerol-3-phosphate acyltransferase